MSQPLAGVRVLDLTGVLAGPFCTYQLVLMGAEVIKIEVPHRGDLTRQLGADVALNARQMGSSFLAQNAGKKSITLNLKTDAARAVFRRFVESSDVVVENFRPGVMAKLGFGYNVLSGWNPRLVYCAISGYGQDGPLADTRAYDQIIQGISGAMSVTGDEHSAPLRIGYPVSDTTGGMAAAFALVSALYDAARSGKGRFVDVSMLDATIASMAWVVSNYLICHQTPKPIGNENFTASPSGTFRAGKGQLNIAANEQRQYEALCRVIDRADLATDPRFAARESRKAHRAELKREIETALAAESAVEWVERLTEAGVPAGLILTLPEALDHPQVRHRKLVYSLDMSSSLDREVSFVRGGYTVSGSERVAPTPPPTLGEHTDEVLAGFGYTEADIASFRAEGVI
jgi:crotonobetainyl-CoA:carnitine CoA-transferase CaiB-like acyl-CoA transferase